MNPDLLQIFNQYKTVNTNVTEQMFEETYNQFGNEYLNTVNDQLKKKEDTQLTPENLPSEENGISTIPSNEIVPQVVIDQLQGSPINQQDERFLQNNIQPILPIENSTESDSILVPNSTESASISPEKYLPKEDGFFDLLGKYKNYDPNTGIFSGKKRIIPDEEIDRATKFYDDQNAKNEQIRKQNEQIRKQNSLNFLAGKPKDDDVVYIDFSVDEINQEQKLSDIEVPGENDPKPYLRTDRPFQKKGVEYSYYAEDPDAVRENNDELLKAEKGGWLILTTDLRTGEIAKDKFGNYYHTYISDEAIDAQNKYIQSLNDAAREENSRRASYNFGNLFSAPTPETETQQYLNELDKEYGITLLTPEQREQLSTAEGRKNIEIELETQKRLKENKNLNYNTVFAQVSKEKEGADIQQQITNGSNYVNRMFFGGGIATNARKSSVFGEANDGYYSDDERDEYNFYVNYFNNPDNVAAFGAFMDDDGKALFDSSWIKRTNVSQNQEKRKEMFATFLSWKGKQDRLDLKFSQDALETNASKAESYRAANDLNNYRNEVSKVNFYQKKIQKATAKVQENVNELSNSSQFYSKSNTKAKEKADFQARVQNDEFSANAQNFIGNVFLGATTSVQNAVTGLLRISAVPFGKGNVNDFIDIVSEPISVGNVDIARISDEIISLNGNGKEYKKINGYIYEVGENGKIFRPTSKIDENSLKETDRTRNINSSGLAFVTSKMLADIYLTTSTGAGINSRLSFAANALSNSKKITAIFGEGSQIANQAATFARTMQSPTANMITGWTVQMYNDNYLAAKDGGIENETNRHLYAFTTSFLLSQLQRINPDTNFLKTINTEYKAIVSNLMENNTQKAILGIQSFTKKAWENTSKELVEENLQQGTQDLTNIIVNATGEKNLQVSTLDDYKDVFIGTIVPSLLASGLGGRVRQAEIGGRKVDLTQLTRNELVTELARSTQGVQLLKEFRDNAYFESQQNEADKLVAEIQERQKYINKIPDAENYSTETINSIIPLLQEIDRKQQSKKNDDGTFTARIDVEISNLTTKVNEILDQDAETTQSTPKPEAVQEQGTNPKNQSQQGTPSIEQNTQGSINENQTITQNNTPQSQQGTPSIEQSTQGSINENQTITQNNTPQSQQGAITEEQNIPSNLNLESNEKQNQSPIPEQPGITATPSEIGNTTNETSENVQTKSSENSKATELPKVQINQDIFSDEIDPTKLSEEQATEYDKQINDAVSMFESLNTPSVENENTVEKNSVTEPTNVQQNPVTQNSNLQDNQILITDNVIATSENITLPDGEKGIKITVTDNEGNLLEDRNGDSEFEFATQEDVDKFINQKKRGYSLSKNKSSSINNRTSTDRNLDALIGTEITFTQFGENKSGTVTSVENGKLLIKGSDGKNYTSGSSLVQNVKDSFGNDVKLQQTSQQFSGITKSAFDALIEKLKKPFAKAFKNLNITTDWNAFQEKAKALGLNINFNSQFQIDPNARKQKQLALINKTNPAPNDYNTWIRSEGDILTAEEAFSEAFEDGEMYPDFTVDEMQEAIDSGEITIYSSRPIEEGSFITPSKMNAEQYAGGPRSKVYSKKVKITDIAWIDQGEGQFAPIQEPTINFNIRTDRQGNPIGDGGWNIEPSIINLSNYPQIDYDIDDSKTTESTYVKYYNKDNGESVTVRFSNHNSNAVKFGDQLDGYSAGSNEILHRLGLKKRIFNPEKSKNIGAYQVKKAIANQYEESDKTIQEIYALPIGSDLSEYKGKRAKGSNWIIGGETVKEVSVMTKNAFGQSVERGTYSYEDIQFMHTANGEIYGAKLPDGTIYFNPEKINANTPIHEFSHLWEQLLPKAWAKGLEIFKQTKTGKDLHAQLKQEGNYANLTDEQLWSEAMNTHIGNIGEERYQNPKGKMAQFMEWLRTTFAKLGEFLKFGGKLTPETKLKTFTEKVLGDLMGGKPVTVEAEMQSNGSTQYSFLTENDFDSNGNIKPEVLAEIQAEREQIKSDAIANGTFMKAPNGKDTNLNEAQWIDVRTKRFTDWFGDWENDAKNASKVVDENGEPLVVYHGTGAKRFNIFAPLSFFTDKKEIAERYSKQVQEDGTLEPNLYPVFLNIRKLKELPMFTLQQDRIKVFTKTKSINGTINPLGNTGAVEFVVKTPNQIKSATENLGTYSNKTGRIDFQIIGEQGARNLDAAEEATTRLDNLSVAREMETAGKTEKEIRLATGWEKGADVKWRYEISDVKIIDNVVYDGIARDTVKVRSFGEWLGITRKDHNPDYLLTLGPFAQSADLIKTAKKRGIDLSMIFEAYPQLKNIKLTSHKPNQNNAKGFLQSENNLFETENKPLLISIREDINPVEANSILIHEIQHAVQEYEGFASGGNIQSTTNLSNEEIQQVSQVEKAIKDAQNLKNSGELVYESSSLSEIISTDSSIPSEIKNWAINIVNSGQKEIDIFLNETPLRKYQILAGEVEARNAQTRASMSMAERRATLLSETEDVAREDQIILFQSMGISESNSGSSINKKAMPKSTFAAVANATSQNGREAGYQELINSNWFKSLQPEVQEGITSYNFQNTMIEQARIIQSNDKIARENIVNKTKEKGKEAVKKVKQEAREKIKEIVDEYKDKIKALKADTKKSAREKSVEQRRVLRAAVKDIKSHLASSVFIGRITPAEANRLIHKASELGTRKDLSAAVKEFTKLYDEIKNKAESRVKQKEFTLDEYNELKPIIEQLKNSGMSLDEVLENIKNQKLSNKKAGVLNELYQNQIRNIYEASGNENLSPEKAYEQMKEKQNESVEAMTDRRTFAQKVKQAVHTAIKLISDRQYLPKKLLQEIGAMNTKSRMVAMAGASARARIVFDNLNKKIFDGLKAEDKSELNAMIVAKRILSIEKNRTERGLPPMKHPYANPEQALQGMKDKLGDEKFADLENRADEYFKAFKGILTEMRDNGLISQDAYESMIDIDYQPRLFIDRLLDADGKLDADGNFQNFSGQNGGLKSEILKSLGEGSDSAIIDNAEWLLKTALASRFKAMAMNEVNRRFMTDEFWKAKDRFDAIDPKNFKNKAEEKFYNYFKELQAKIKDNPIIGTTESGMPKYRYDTAPQGFTKAYYYVDGVKNEFFLADDFHKEWHDVKEGLIFDPKAKGIINKYSGAALIKAMATGYNPTFAFTNTPRDFMQTLVFSPEYSNNLLFGTFQLGKDQIKSVIRMFKEDFMGKEDAILQKYLEYGGGMDFLYVQGLADKDRKLHNSIRKVLDSKIFEVVTLMKLSKWSEMMTRMAIFERSIKNQLKELGLKDINQITNQEQQDDIYFNAVNSARSIMDFNQGGKLVKDLDAVMPYLNAATQGTRVAIDAFRERPLDTSIRMFQAGGLMASTAIGMSYALLAMAKGIGDDDDEKSITENILNAYDGLSQYQRANYINIVMPWKNDKGEYHIFKIAKTQFVAPLSYMMEEGLLNVMRKTEGKEEKDFMKIMQETGWVSNKNMTPIEMGTPDKMITSIATKNPLMKASLTYTTGYDFFKEEVVTFDVKKSNFPKELEGYKDQNVEDFYKEIGSLTGGSPARMKAFVESIVTTPETNPFVTMMYGGADLTNAVINGDSKSEVASELKDNISKVFTKRLIGEASDFNRMQKKREKVEKEVEEAILKDEKLKYETDILAKQFKDKKIEMPEVADKIKQLNLNSDELEKTIKRFDKKIKNKVSDNRIYDVMYSTASSNRAKAILINEYFPEMWENSIEGDLIRKELSDNKLLREDILKELIKIKKGE